MHAQWLGARPMRARQWVGDVHNVPALRCLNVLVSEHVETNATFWAAFPGPGGFQELLSVRCELRDVRVGAATG